MQEIQYYLPEKKVGSCNATSISRDDENVIMRDPTDFARVNGRLDNLFFPFINQYD